VTVDEAIRLITAVGACVGSIAALIAVFKIEKVHKATNSLVDRLVITTREKAHAAGVKEGEERSG
jgi:hypothetical protein